MLTSDEINRRVDEAIGYRFGEARRSRSIRPLLVLVVLLAIAVAVRLLVRA
jgi:hypothetical protein